MRNFAYKLLRRMPRRHRVTLGVRSLVKDGEGRVLLVRHTYVEGWFLPGGAVDPRETLSEAMARELLEECGIQARGQRFVGMYFNGGRARSDHIALFEVIFWERRTATGATGEIAEMDFFHPDELPAGTSPATKRRIQELLGGRAPSESW